QDGLINYFVLYPAYIISKHVLSDNKKYFCKTNYMQERKQNNNTTIIYWNKLILGISVIVIMYYYFSNRQVTNVLNISQNNNILGQIMIYSISILVGTSETVRVFSNYLTSSQKQDLKTRQWIAGLVDGDGTISISKKGYCTIEVVIEVRDIACLMKLKNRYGGSVKLITKGTAYRFRIHHKQGILQFIQDINGMFHNPVRLEQFKKLCILYNISFMPTTPLHFDSAYLSGLFDSDGSIYINITSNQVFITISQKRRYLIDLICNIYGGKVYSASTKNSAFKWTVYKKSEVIYLVENYFHWNSCTSAKNKRFKIVKEFYNLSSQGLLHPKNEYEQKVLEKYIKDWKNYGTVDNLSKKQSTFYLIMPLFFII
ncbi:unnamed protein product, partial (mitochondrion) [Parajaminaea phylloscopi]